MVQARSRRRCEVGSGFPSDYKASTTKPAGLHAMTIAALHEAIAARPGAKVVIVGRALAQQLFETDELAIEARFYDLPKDEMAAEIVQGRLAEDGVEPEASFAIPRMTLRAAPHVLILPAGFAEVEGMEAGGFLLLGT